VLAKAEADRIRIQAEAAASHNRVALDRMLIDQLPQIVREAAAGLQGADITVLNGAEGLSEIAAGLVSQGLAIFETVRHNLSPVDTPSGALGEPRTGYRRADRLTAAEAPRSDKRLGRSPGGPARELRIPRRLITPAMTMHRRRR
jgi:flotillin